MQIVVRWGAGNSEAIRKYADELVARAPDVIVTDGSPTTALLLQMTVPIVFVQISAPHHRNSLKGLQKTAMRSDDYRRLRETFVEIALQRPDLPEGTRWLAIAQACLIYRKLGA